MPQTSDEVRAARRAQVAAIARKVLEKRGEELAQCGLKSKELKEFSAQTGFWADPADVTPKPPRWLVQLRVVEGQVIASLPSDSHGKPLHGTDRIAFANTAKGKVGGLLVRVLPVLAHPGGEYTLYDAWEWALLFAFGGAIPRGSSGQVFHGYSPDDGSLFYKEAPLAYATMQLFALCESSDSITLNDGTTAITYGQATDAITAFLHESGDSTQSNVIAAAGKGHGLLIEVDG